MSEVQLCFLLGFQDKVLVNSQFSRIWNCEFATQAPPDNSLQDSESHHSPVVKGIVIGLSLKSRVVRSDLHITPPYSPIPHVVEQGGCQ